MKTKYAFYFLFLMVLFGFPACMLIDLEDLPEVEPPVTTGKVNLVTDWTNRSEGIDIPSVYMVEINNQRLQFTNAVNALPELEANTYPALIYNIPEKISIQGATATVQTTDNTVDMQPGWLFSSAMDIMYEADKEKSVTTVMEQQIRQLSIELTVTGGNPERISAVEATLSGVANTLDIKTGQVSGSNLHVKPDFIRQDDKLRAVVHLLGVTGTQKFSLTLTFSDGKHQTIESELTENLVGFNVDKYIPMSLTAELNTPVGIGFEATITGWETTTDSSGIAW